MKSCHSHITIVVSKPRWPKGLSLRPWSSLICSHARFELATNQSITNSRYLLINPMITLTSARVFLNPYPHCLLLWATSVPQMWVNHSPFQSFFLSLFLQPIPVPRFTLSIIQYYSVICRPSDHTVGRPRTDIRIRDGLSNSRATKHKTTTPPIFRTYCHPLLYSKCTYWLIFF